ncbi:MAG: hypothetical protein LC648_05090 [Novosphingobium sp.]|nr:hypothetical protein [Novosphingobium sp.]
MTTRGDRRRRRLAILDAGAFEHPSYQPIEGIERALERLGVPRTRNASYLERVWSRVIIRFDLTRFYGRLSRTVHFVVVMNLPARRFYPQGWWAESVAYCLDCWSPRYDEWERFLRRNRVRIAFFNARDPAREMARRLPGQAIAYLPEAVDPGDYRPDRPLRERGIDLLEYGRLWGSYHARIAPHCRAKGHAHRYRTGDELMFPTLAELRAALADARLVVSVPQTISHPDHAGTTETMPMRFLEVIASGALPFGRCPKDMLELFGYNPVIEIDDAEPERQLDRVLGEIESYEELRLRNLETLRRVASWDGRARELLIAIARLDPELCLPAGAGAA